MFKPKLLQQEQGFTLVEVLVAILITIMFTAIAMQMMVFAAVFRARAEEFTKVTTWIQEDLEDVKYNAASLQYTSLIDEANGDSVHEATDTLLHVASVLGFQLNDTLIVGTDTTTTYTIASVDTTANTITLNPATALSTNHSTNTVVVATNKCNPPNMDAGFAKHLQDNLPALSISNRDVGLRRILGRDYTLTRTSNIKNFSNYAVLELTYSVTSPSAVSPVANFYTEVIPNAALRCPP